MLKNKKISLRYKAEHDLLKTLLRLAWDHARNMRLEIPSRLRSTTGLYDLVLAPR